MFGAPTGAFTSPIIRKRSVLTRTVNFNAYIFIECNVVEQYLYMPNNVTRSRSGSRRIVYKIHYSYIYATCYAHPSGINLCPSSLSCTNRSVYSTFCFRSLLYRLNSIEHRQNVVRCNTIWHKGCKLQNKNISEIYQSLNSYEHGDIIRPDGWTWGRMFRYRENDFEISRICCARPYNWNIQLFIIHGWYPAILPRALCAWSLIHDQITDNQC